MKYSFLICKMKGKMKLVTFKLFFFLASKLYQQELLQKPGESVNHRGTLEEGPGPSVSASLSPQLLSL